MLNFRIKLLATSLAAILTIISSISAFAVDFTSQNYILRDPSLAPVGGSTTSNNFQTTNSVGMMITGSSNSANYTLQPGLSYLIEPETSSGSGIGSGGGGSGGTATTSTPAAGDGGVTSDSTTTKKTKGSITSPGKVRLQGVAYPQSKVTILKDGQNQGTYTTDQKGNFNIIIKDLTSGNYNFVIYAEDKNGLKSKNFSKSLTVEDKKIKSIKDIKFEPTLYIDKSEVKKSDYLKISGQTLPTSKVSLIITKKDKKTKKVTTVQTISKISDKKGNFSHKLWTKKLQRETYYIEVKSRNGLLSNPLMFKVGKKNISIDKNSLKGDLNKKDGIINLIDFVILSYWKDRTVEENTVDLNNDGVVNLTDFSIMASHWTG